MVTSLKIFTNHILGECREGVKMRNSAWCALGSKCAMFTKSYARSTTYTSGNATVRSKHSLSTGHTIYRSGKQSNTKINSEYQKQLNYWYETRKTAIVLIEGWTGKIDCHDSHKIPEILLI
jgi:hypothetical protein